MIISRTPVRLSFFGGGTDYREYFETNGGAVMGTTINKFVFISVNRLSEFFEYKVRVGYSKSELVNRVEEIVHPSVRETLRYMNVPGHLDIHIFADLPARTGLGSSSTFTVGFLNALYALEGKVVSKQRLAEEAIYIEQELIGENVGCQDQAHAAFGGLNVIEFSKKGLSVRPVVITREKYEALESSLLVFYTGLSRFASEIAKEQIENTRKKVMNRYLMKMHRMVSDAENIISVEDPLEMVRSLGEMLDEGWALKKCLSNRITNDFIDRLYEKAKKAGAHGGKLAGAGGGGFLFLFVPEEKKAAVRKAMGNLLEVKFRFESEGSKIIYLTT
jgi:D-glycero-alpha-D-manno-heptose-7-phosphate kinase